MKILDTILYIEWREAIECGLSDNTLRNAKLRNSPSYHFINDPADRRKNLIGYEKLSPANKEKINARYGCPYTYLARQPIRQLIKWDAQAEEYYMAYRYGDGEETKTLPLETVKKYTQAASVLNMIRELTADKKALKKMLNQTIEQFFDHVIDIIKAENISLPASYRRLVVNENSALKQYLKEGYASLIHAHFGKRHAAKITDELCTSVLLEMVAHHNNYDDVFVCWQYNKWANENSYKPIHPSTVGLYRRAKGNEVAASRTGTQAQQNRYVTSVRGQRPSAPLLLAENDDNHLDLSFINPENAQGSYRYVAMVVKDSYNDYVLGYAAGILGTLDQGQTKELVRAAWVNAMYHIRELTGGWYLPHELKTDKFGLSAKGEKTDLHLFYESIGHYTPGKFGGKNNRYIEASFGHIDHKRALKWGANNYTGHNNTAKYRGVNLEAVKRNKKNWPAIGTEAEQQIADVFHRLRHMPRLARNAQELPSRHAQWLTAWHQMPADKKRPISDEKFLLTFGIKHAPKNGSLNRLTNRGVDMQLTTQGQPHHYSYVIDGGTPLHLINKEVQVVYDPYDMSRVLLTNYEDVRLLAHEPRLSPRAIADSHTDSRTFLNACLDEKKDQVTRMAGKAAQRQDILHRAGFTAEAILQDGTLTKELKQAAEVKFLAQQLTDSDIDTLSIS